MVWRCVWEGGEVREEFCRRRRRRNEREERGVGEI